MDPFDDVLLIVRCYHANGEDVIDVMLCKLVIKGGIIVGKFACVGIGRPTYLVMVH